MEDVIRELEPSVLVLELHVGFPHATGGKEPACQCQRLKRSGFNCWVGKIPQRRGWQPIPVFLPGESHRQRRMGGYSSQGRYCCCCRCQVASVMSNSVRPHRWQPSRLPRPWDSPGKNTRVGCHFLLQCMKVKSEK